MQTVAISLCTREEPAIIAERIGDGGWRLEEAADRSARRSASAAIRERRVALTRDAKAVVQNALGTGSTAANRTAEATLGEMRSAMNMDYGI